MRATTSYPLDSLDAIQRFESEATFEERCSAAGIHDLLVQAAAAHGERTALTMVMTGEDDEVVRSLTHNQLRDGVTQAANLFASLAGVRAGVAYMLPNLIETHLTLWGAEVAGFAVPLNFLLQTEHLVELIAASGARILVTLGPHPTLGIWEKALAVRERLPELILLQVAFPGTPAHDGVLGFEQALAAQPSDALRHGRAGRGDELVAYFHTGGTTGSAKLVTHTHRNQIVAAFGGAALLGLTERDVMTNGMPLFHVGGCIVSALSVLMVGGNVLILSPTGVRNAAMVRRFWRFWRIVERHRATLLGGVPTAWSAILEVPVDGDLSSVRLGFVGAASAPLVLAGQFEKATGKQLHEVIGMTETGGLLAIAPAAARPVVGCVGWRLPYTDTSVRQLLADGSLGAVCAAREIGVLTISGPTVSPGYSDPARNDGVFGADFLNSGDLAYTDEEGRIFIAGRAKDLIIRSGHNIDPAMIENALAQHPDVRLAAAVGQPDRYAGEVPVCYVTLNAGTEVSPEALSAFGELHIAERPAWPRRIFIVDEIPVTGVGKIFKPTLRCDATWRIVIDEVNKVAGMQLHAVEVSAGGKRGMDVSVSLNQADDALIAAVHKALEGFLFNVSVHRHG